MVGLFLIPENLCNCPYFFMTKTSSPTVSCLAAAKTSSLASRQPGSLGAIASRRAVTLRGQKLSAWTLLGIKCRMHFPSSALSASPLILLNVLLLRSQQQVDCRSAERERERERGEKSVMTRNLFALMNTDQLKIRSMWFLIKDN